MCAHAMFMFASWTETMRHHMTNDLMRRYGGGLTDKEQLIIRALSADLATIGYHARSMAWHLDDSLPQSNVSSNNKRAMMVYLKSPRLPR